MSGVLIASPSTFLRIGLVQQLRRRRPNLSPAEAATVPEALRILGGEPIDLVIIDDALMSVANGVAQGAMLERHPCQVLVITTRDPPAIWPAIARPVRTIAGTVDGVLNMGAIARSLPAALDELGARPSVRRSAGSTIAAPPRLAGRMPGKRPEIVLVAASTGGPSALTILLRDLGRSRLPIIVAQHMPADQTAGFARHLAVQTGLDVIELGSGDVPAGAPVAVLRGGSDYRVKRGTAGQFRLVATEIAGNVFHPSADLLFGSAAEAGLEAVAVVLSGMGDDGARGAAAIAARGGRVLVQDFVSCVVAGMPSATHAACPSAAVVSLPALARHLHRWTAPLTRPLATIEEG